MLHIINHFKLGMLKIPEFHMARQSVCHSVSSNICYTSCAKACYASCPWTRQSFGNNASYALRTYLIMPLQGWIWNAAAGKLLQVQGVHQALSCLDLMLISFRMRSSCEAEVCLRLAEII